MKQTLNNFDKMLNMVEKEAIEGKTFFLENQYLSHNCSDRELDQMLLLAALKLAENGHKEALSKLNELEPLSKDTQIACIKIALAKGQRDTALCIKTMAQDSLKKEKIRDNIFKSFQKKIHEKAAHGPSTIDKLREADKRYQEKIREELEEEKSQTLEIIGAKSSKNIVIEKKEAKTDIPKTPTHNNHTRVNGMNITMDKNGISGTVKVGDSEHDIHEFVQKTDSGVNVVKFDHLENCSFFGSSSNEKIPFEDFMKQEVESYDQEQHDGSFNFRLNDFKGDLSVDSDQISIKEDKEER